MIIAGLGRDQRPSSSANTNETGLEYYSPRLSYAAMAGLYQTAIPLFPLVTQKVVIH